MNLNLPLKVKITLFSGAISSIAILIFGYFISPNCKELTTTYIIIMFGSILGWLIGIITSPYDENKDRKLGKYSKLIGTFVSGFVVSKFGEALQKFVNEDLFQSELVALRLVLFLCTFIMVWIVVFVCRI